MIELTDQLRQAVAENPNDPLQLVDTKTHHRFVLIRAEVYDRLKALVYDDSECPVSEGYALMDEVAAKAGWDNPEMDIYNDLAPKDVP